jgi:Fic family protein
MAWAGLLRARNVNFLISEMHPFDDGNGRLARVTITSAGSAA